YQREYAIHYPEEELPAGRPLKTDPLHDRLLERGAVMGSRFGWERPLWFSRDGARDEYSFRRPNWFAAVGEECRAVRASCGALEDVTSRYGVLTLAGPLSRELLKQLADTDVSREAFPFFRARHICVGPVPTLTLRVSYVGELGFELHHPLEYQRTLYDLVVAA